MPCPRSVKRVTVNGHEGTLVDLTGIAHFVVEGVEPSEGFFRAAESIFPELQGLTPAASFSSMRKSAA